jgi:photosystem II stability/assembly factor-like uncharacterized protein
LKPTRAFHIIFYPGIISLFLFFAGCKKNMEFQNSNWTYPSTNTTGTITDIQFSTIDTGFIFGYSDSRPFISETTDGGDHWHLVKAFDDSYPVLMSFYPITSAHLLVIRNTLYSSMDGGSTWNKAHPRSITHKISMRLLACAFWIIRADS